MAPVFTGCAAVRAVLARDGASSAGGTCLWFPYAGSFTGIRRVWSIAGGSVWSTDACGRVWSTAGSCPCRSSDLRCGRRSSHLLASPFTTLAAAGTEFFPPGSAVVPPGSTTFEPFRAISSLVPAEPRPVSVPGDILARRDHGSSPSSDDENHIVRRGAAPAARPVSPGGGPASASSRSGATSVGDRSSERIDPLSPKRSSEPRTPRTRRVPRIVPSEK